ncbi:hypothetical protein HDV03_003881 [Kappamyces sp. JEL0829]|nr:hypothetical protein HDV03_003881 [Kappamyces sp. JEL0829]
MSWVSRILYLFSWLLLVRAKCTAINTTSVCYPFAHGTSIDLDKLSDFYGTEIASELEWQRLLEKGGSLGWASWLGCPAVPKARLHSMDHWQIRYGLTYMCLTDIFVLSFHCNHDIGFKDTNIIPMCDNICTEFGKSVATLSHECAKFDRLHSAQEALEIAEHRALASTAASQCQKVLDLPLFNSSLECQEGVTSDSDLCGFQDKALGKQYCSRHADARCCILGQSRSSLFQSIKFFPDSASNPLAAMKHSATAHKFSPLYERVYLYSSLACFIVVFGLGLVIVSTRTEPRPVLLRHRRSGHISFRRRGRSRSPRRTLV